MGEINVWKIPVVVYNINYSFFHILCVVCLHGSEKSDRLDSEYLGFYGLFRRNQILL